MKRILLNIAAIAAVAVSCTKFEQDAPINYKETPDPEVAINVLSDNSVSVKVTPKEGTTYYSYIVVKGQPAEVDADALLAGRYASNALKLADGTPAAGVVNYENVPEVNIAEIGSLASNTPYSVYAVAVNKQGVKSKVVSATTSTTDGTIPNCIPAGCQSQEKDGVLLIAIPFDDPVTLTGNGEVKAHIICQLFDPDYNFVETGEYTVPAENLMTQGNVLYVQLPQDRYTPGAFVTITFDEGIVKNGKDAVNEAYTDAVISFDGRQIVTEALAFQYKSIEFALSRTADGTDEPEDPEKFSNIEDFMMLSYSTGKYPLLEGAYGDKPVTITTTSGDGRTVTYTTDDFDILDAETKTLVVMLSEEPLRGSLVSYTIPAGSFYDIYGNSNAEFTVTDGYLYAYDFVLDDILGTFRMQGYQFNEELNGLLPFGPATLKLEQSDDKSKGNVKVTDYFGVRDLFGVETVAPVYAKFTPDMGTLVIPRQQKLFEAEPGSGMYAVTDGMTQNMQGEDIVFQLDESGTLTSVNFSFGVFLGDISAGAGMPYGLLIRSVSGSKVQ